MQDLENNNYQNEIIGILANKPEYFKRTVLRKEYFDNIHGIMFEIMQKSYRENGAVLHELLLSDKRVNDMEYLNCISNIIHSYPEYFDALEKYAIDQYKEKIIFNESMKLKNHTINLEQFNNTISNLNKVGIIKGNKLTEKKIIDSLTKNKKKITFNKFKVLESKLSLVEKDLVILAGKTGAGKTAFALNLLEDLSKNYPCLYFNMEMLEENLIKRVIALCTNLKFSTVGNFEKLPQNAIEAIKKNAHVLGERDIEIKSESQSIEKIRSYISSYDSNGKHFIVFIDHMGLISARGKTSYEVATRVAKELRRISLDNNCTIISLCQLSREAKKAQRPSLDLLRDSGEIEQSARKVLFVWEENEKYYLRIEKNDSGALSTIPVIFDKNKQLFKEIEGVRP